MFLKFDADRDGNKAPINDGLTFKHQKHNLLCVTFS